MAHPRPVPPPRPEPLGTPSLDGTAYVSAVDWMRSGSWFSPVFIADKLLKNAFGKQTAFMTSDPDIYHDIWQPVQIIGEGGFGCVGLWKKTDAAGNAVDEMVIKETAYNQYLNEGQRIAVPGVRGLFYEAVINRDLNAHAQGSSINHLLQYKYNPASHRSRFYTIYCPHGDLRRLQLIYHAWDRFLPELFIWHLFIGLARAYEALSAPPPADTQIIADDPSTYFTLHCDLKPDNVFLDRTTSAVAFDDATTGDDLLNSYPAVRMADLGLALCTDVARDPENNPVNFHSRGTPDFYPPEQSNWGSKFQLRPYAQQQPYEKKFNAWGIGQVIFDVMASRGREHLNAVMNRPLAEECWDDQWHFFWSADEWASGEVTNFYSEELRQLVYDCLKPLPAARPSAPELLKRAQEGSLKFRQSLIGNPNAVAAQRLYHEQNAINVLGVGAAKLKATKDEVIELRKFADPELPRWQFPMPRYAEILEDNKDPPFLRFRFSTGGNIAFRRHSSATGSVATGVREDADGRARADADARARADADARAKADADVKAKAAADAKAKADADKQAKADAAAAAAAAVLPTQQDYEALTKDDLSKELIHRDNNLKAAELKKSRKSSLVRRVQAMDQNGTLGRGAHQATRSNKRKR